MTLLEIATSSMNYIESLFFKEFENIIFFIICSSLSFIILFFFQIIRFSYIEIGMGALSFYF